MGYKYRGLIKNRGEVVDIIDFSKDVAKCTDGKDRNIDEFNTIFYPAQDFKKEILKIQEEEKVEVVDEVIETPKTKKSNS